MIFGLQTPLSTANGDSLRSLVYRNRLTVSAEDGICYNTAIELPEDAVARDAVADP